MGFISNKPRGRDGIGGGAGGGSSRAAAFVAQWVAAINAAGSTVDATAVNAANNLAETLIPVGLWDKSYVIDLCAGDNRTAALIRFKVPSGVPRAYVNNNFVDGDYTQATGLTGNGTTKYLATGLNPVTQGWSTSNLGMWAYTRTAVVGTGTSRVTMGSTGTGGDQNTALGWIQTGSRESGGVAKDTAESFPAGSASSVTGFLGVSANGSRVNQFYRNGVATGATATLTDTLASMEFYHHAVNVQGGGASAFCNRAIGSSCITQGLSAAEAALLYNAFLAFETALGRNV
jgi:hypothetical protein